MDNCAGTNKSQFCFGGIALLAMSGNLDTILLMFQLQGHTKFDPDIAAQKTAGAFNSRDTFNHGMLNNHFSDHVTTIAYDHKLLKDWKAATPDIFEPVDNITSYRNFMLLADDGKVDLGEPLKKTDTPAKDFPSSGKVSSSEVQEREAQKLAQRSLLEKILPAVHRKSFSGIGSGSGDYGPRTSALVSATNLPEIRKVRLFVRLSSAYEFYIEQENYMKTTDRATIEAALSRAVSVEPVPYTGPRESQIKEQMKLFVPKQYVPDRFAVSEKGNSGLVKVTPTITKFIMGAPHPTAPAGVAPGSSTIASASSSGPNIRRWKGSTDGPRVKALCNENHNGNFPKQYKKREAIANALGVDYNALKNNFKKIDGLEREN